MKIIRKTEICRKMGDGQCMTLLTTKEATIFTWIVRSNFIWSWRGRDSTGSRVWRVLLEILRCLILLILGLRLSDDVHRHVQIPKSITCSLIFQFLNSIILRRLRDCRSERWHWLSCASIVIISVREISVSLIATTVVSRCARAWPVIMIFEGRS